MLSEGEEEEESLQVESEGEGEGVDQLLRNTVDELEAALKDTRQLLATRDGELSQLKLELDRYKQQAAREIANKTRLAQALDQSQSHVAQLEEILQNWQLQVTYIQMQEVDIYSLLLSQLQEFKTQSERLQSALQAERVHKQELESRLVAAQQHEKEVEELRNDLERCKLQLHGKGARKPWQQQPSSPDSAAIDGTQQLFLKQAVYYLLTDFHAEEQLRAIISILDFNAQERKAVYSKMQEKGGLYK